MTVSRQLCSRNAFKLDMDLKTDQGNTINTINPSISKKYIYFRGLVKTKYEWINNIMLYNKESNDITTVPYDGNIEDLRIFDVGDRTMFVGYDRNKYRVFETLVGTISLDGTHIDDITCVIRKPFIHVKNLMPLVVPDSSEFYVIDIYTRTCFDHTGRECGVIRVVDGVQVPDKLAGSTQFLYFADKNVWGGVAHVRNNVSYDNYWVELSRSVDSPYDFVMNLVSGPFFISVGTGIDFISGINIIENTNNKWIQLMYGVNDEYTYRCEIHVDELRRNSTAVLYVSYHIGTWTNIDAIAEANGWELYHLRPPHGYQVSQAVADKAWKEYYEDFLTKENHRFSYIIVSDTIPTCLGFADYIRKNKDIKLILQVTNYFDFGNSGNSWYYNELHKLVQLNNVFVTYVDPFIGRYLFGISGMYIPLSGKTTAKRYPAIVWNGEQAYYDAADPIVTDKKVCTCTDGITHNLVYKLPRMYGGPSALANFDAIIYFPYHYSTISLHEFLSAGLIVLMPTFAYLKQCMPPQQLHITEELCDAYSGPCRELFEYFNDQDELESLINRIYADSEWVNDKKKTINSFMNTYDKLIFSIWATLIPPTAP